MTVPGLALAVAWALGGCADDATEAGVSDASVRAFNAGHAPNRNRVSAGELCDRLATIQCAGEAHCCHDPGRSQAQCYATMRAGCDDEIHLDDIAEARSSGFDEATAAIAFSEFENLASRCDPGIAQFGYTLDGLRGIMKGSVAPGGSCTPPSFPALIPSNTTAAVALASCGSAATHACRPAISLWRCEPLAPEDGECFTDINCQDGLYCNNPRLALTASCVPRKPPGADCSLPNECQTLACRDGLCADADDEQATYCLQ